MNIFKDEDESFKKIKEAMNNSKRMISKLDVADAIRSAVTSAMSAMVFSNGEYPNLCSGTLVLAVDGKKRAPSHALCSGGNAWFDKDRNSILAYGPWSVERPEDLEPYQKEIERLVNDKVHHGCCGGCL